MTDNTTKALVGALTEIHAYVDALAPTDRFTQGWLKKAKQALAAHSQQAQGQQEPK